MRFILSTNSYIPWKSICLNLQIDKDKKRKISLTFQHAAKTINNKQFGIVEFSHVYNKCGYWTYSVRVSGDVQTNINQSKLQYESCECSFLSGGWGIAQWQSAELQLLVSPSRGRLLKFREAGCCFSRREPFFTLLRQGAMLEYHPWLARYQS